MHKVISSSWASVGILPFDSTKVLKKLKKFHSREEKGEDKEIIDKVLELIEEKYEIKKKEQEKKKERKAESKTISFNTTTTKILNSSTSLAQNRIAEEWQICNKLKKASLLSRITRQHGFQPDEGLRKKQSLS